MTKEEMALIENMRPILAKMGIVGRFRYSTDLEFDGDILTCFGQCVEVIAGEQAQRAIDENNIARNSSQPLTYLRVAAGLHPWQAWEIVGPDDGNGIPVFATPVPEQAQPAGKFKLGDLVTKTKGSNWTGRVVGTYSTALTPEGYAVESSTEHGSVQIYPASALAAIDAARAQEGEKP